MIKNTIGETVLRSHIGVPSLDAALGCASTGLDVQDPAGFRRVDGLAATAGITGASFRPWRPLT
jgi:hypothetical protein